jgi:thiamine-phosphate pyrophosphorylase
MTAFRILNSESLHLYAILDLGYVAEERAVEVARALLKGGADLLQLRAKGKDLAVIERVALALIPLCREVGIPFILNDHAALAAKLGTDGLHIGQDDGSLVDARKVVGEQMIVGRSTHSLDQARAALAEGFDCIGFGPLFPTPTKQGRPGIGLQDVAQMECDVGSKIPAFCIGGIKRSNLLDVLDAGARRVVIVSDLLTAEDPAATTAEVKGLLKERGHSAH